MQASAGVRLRAPPQMRCRQCAASYCLRCRLAGDPRLPPLPPGLALPRGLPAARPAAAAAEPAGLKARMVMLMRWPAPWGVLTLTLGTSWVNSVCKQSARAPASRSAASQGGLQEQGPTLQRCSLGGRRSLRRSPSPPACRRPSPAPCRAASLPSCRRPCCPCSSRAMHAVRAWQNAAAGLESVGYSACAGPPHPLGLACTAHFFLMTKLRVAPREMEMIGSPSTSASVLSECLEMQWLPSWYLRICPQGRGGVGRGGPAPPARHGRRRRGRGRVRGAGHPGGPAARTYQFTRMPLKRLP